jgi:D-alanyl-D-alanine carboxypeptidase (penicillin-binding protein 5/6)
MSETGVVTNRCAACSTPRNGGVIRRLVAFLVCAAFATAARGQLDEVPDLSGLAGGPPEVAARGAVVLDTTTGCVLFEKNADEILYPASATKILTALLVIEAGTLDREVAAEPEDAKVEPSNLDLKPGERHTRLEMLYGLMLKSANDVAQALARDNAGSVEAFAEKMSARAAELGASSSHFTNPHGLHDTHHFTTARDMALIARAAMRQPLFRKIVATGTYQWPGAKGPVLLRNHNRLLGKFPGCTGVKTGYTVPAQQVLVSSAQWGTREVISVVLRTDKPGIWNDSRLLLTFGLSQPLPPRGAE